MNLNRIGRLDGAAIKLIAAALMVLDHIYQLFYSLGAPLWFRLVGRTVAPVFAFFSAEAFFYTRSKRRYMCRLYLGFAAMRTIEVLFLQDLYIAGARVDNNIFETLFLGTVYMWAVDRLRGWAAEKKTKQLVCGILALLLPYIFAHMALASVAVSVPLYTVLSCLVPNIILTEGGIFFVSLCAVFYILHENRAAQLLALAGYSAYAYLYYGASQWVMVFAAVWLLLYNGKPGRMPKSFFYVFYPAHLYILIFIAAAIGLTA